MTLFFETSTPLSEHCTEIRNLEFVAKKKFLSILPFQIYIFSWESGSKEGLKDVIVDPEWGAFGDNGSIDFIKTGKFFI